MTISNIFSPLCCEKRLPRRRKDTKQKKCYAFFFCAFVPLSDPKDSYGKDSFGVAKFNFCKKLFTRRLKYLLLATC